jgi:hypothetical protein
MLGMSACDDSMGLDDNMIVNPWDSTSDPPVDSTNTWVLPDSMGFMARDIIRIIDSNGSSIAKDYQWILKQDSEFDIKIDTLHNEKYIYINVNIINHNELDPNTPRRDRFDRIYNFAALVDSVKINNDYSLNRSREEGLWSSISVESFGMPGYTQYTESESKTEISIGPLSRLPSNSNVWYVPVIIGFMVPSSSPYAQYGWIDSNVLLFAYFTL